MRGYRSALPPEQAVSFASATGPHPAVASLPNFGPKPGGQNFLSTPCSQS
jgi:hypothetical protein